MSTRALGRNLQIPVGIHAETGEPVTVLHLLNSGPAYRLPDDLSREERAAFVADAWRKGLWDGDISIDGAKPLTMEEAIAEIEAGTPNGELLLKTALRALEMLREHVAQARGESA